MKNEEYDKLIRELKNGKCALVLGPEFHLTNSGDENLVKSLRDHLFSTESLKLKPYLTEDGFFYINSEVDRIGQKKDIVYTILDYYEGFKDAVPAHYVSLARLPFYLVISLSPDELMKSAYENIRKPFEYKYFAKGSFTDKVDTREIADDPTKDKPLLINLLGSVENWESMVFTHDSLFEFLYTLFPLERISQKFKSATIKASSFLFLGFSYDKWYLKLVFFLLQKILKEAGKDVEKVAIFNGIDNFMEMKNFYNNEMSFKFNDENVYSFVNELYQKGLANNLIYQTPEPAIGKTDEGKFKILFVCSSPQDKTWTGADIEYRKLEGLLKKSPVRESYEIIPVFAASKNDILSKVNETHPHFLLISSHGNQANELVFMDEDGNAENLTLEVFSADMQVLTSSPHNNLQYVIFNCCNSNELAQEMRKYVKHAIGMKGLIGVGASLAFIEGFFEAFILDRVFDYAYSYGKQMIRKADDHLEYYESPQCFEQ